MPMNQMHLHTLHLAFLLLTLMFMMSCSPTPGDELPSPGTPSLTAKARHASVHLSWAQVEGAATYQIYWSTTQAGTLEMQNASSVTKDLSYLHDGLDNGKTYYYAVAAWNISKGDKSVEIAATPKSRPDTPQQITAVAHDSEVALTWEEATNVTRYYVQTAIDGVVTPAIVETTTSPSFEARNLTNGTRYYFVVTAANEYGDSAASQKIYATPGSLVSLTAGSDHSCALKSDRSIWCWGGNSLGQLANSNIGLTPQALPTLIADPQPTTQWEVLASGAAHSCGIKSDRTLWCWGYNSAGQLGRNAATPNSSPLLRQEASYSKEWSTEPNALTLGTFYSCALKTAGSAGNTLWCWGSNTYGQIGISPSSTNILLPKQIGDDTDNWTVVAAGMNHVCGINTTGKLFCWGNNDQKQLGRGGSNPPLASPLLQSVAEPGPWSTVSAGLDHTCAIKKDQSLWCWGSNDHGALGIEEPQRTIRSVPTPVRAPQRNWRSVTAGRKHTCAIDVAGGLWCWGSNIYGQVGNNGTISQSEPLQIDSSQTWKAVTAGDYHTCAYTLPGHAYCWGYNAQEQLGDGAVVDTTRPVRVRTEGGIKNPATEKNDWQMVFAGGDQSCAIDEKQALWCWGRNVPLASRDGSTTVAPHAARIGDDLGWSAVAMGSALSDDCGLIEGKRRCWRGTPGTPPPEMNTWRSLIAGSLHLCALNTGGSLHCWGRNAEGQLGNGNITPIPDLLKATPVGAGTDQWHSVAGQGNSTCALKIDPMNTLNRKLHCWGDNERLSPLLKMARLPIEMDGTDREVIALGQWHRCGIKTDKTLECSGDNTQGQLNLPSNQASTPWAAITAGSHHTCAVRDNGYLLCWGLNDKGQLGTGPQAPQPSSAKAVMIGSDPLRVTPFSTTEVAAGLNHVCAIHVDGSLRSLWCWGDNSAGQLGDGTAWKKTPHKVTFPN